MAEIKNEKREGVINVKATALSVWVCEAGRSPLCVAAPISRCVLNAEWWEWYRSERGERVSGRHLRHG